MFSVEISCDQPVADFYQELNQLAGGLLSSEQDPIAGMANLSSFLFYTLPDVNWAGFYFSDRISLYLVLSVVSRPVRVFHCIAASVVRQLERTAYYVSRMLMPSVDI